MAVSRPEHANANRSGERKMTIIILEKCAKKSLRYVAGSCEALSTIFTVIDSVAHIWLSCKMFQAIAAMIPHTNTYTKYWIDIFFFVSNESRPRKLSSLTIFYYHHNDDHNPLECSIE